MNSWHSFSPNGRWLVSSSKARSPCTQMYLTHLDEVGNSSLAILTDNASASNRAVNLPEFVNIAGDGIEDIQPNFRSLGLAEIILSGVWALGRGWRGARPLFLDLALQA
jgi:hypothetical protein